MPNPCATSCHAGSRRQGRHPIEPRHVAATGAVQPGDAELGRRFVAGDESAIRDLYRRYSGPMLTIGHRLLGDSDRAHEAVQQAFLQAWRASSQYDPSRNLSSWIYAITRRVCIDLYRRDSRAPALLAEDGVVADDAIKTPDAADGLLDAWEVREAVDALPTDERDVIRLAHFDGLTFPEIAERLGVPLGTVKSRSFRGHKRLADRLSHLRPAVA